MSLYRCAACGSPNVMTDTQNEGISYNYVKGAVGTVVLGAGGAAAGIQSKKTEVFKCPDCGMVLSHPMAPEIAILIETGLRDKSRRNSLKLRGLDMPWDFFTTKYKNMGIGVPDYESHERDYEDTPEAATARKVLKALKDIDLEIALSELSESKEQVDLEELKTAWEASKKDRDAKAEKEFLKAKEKCDLKFEKKASDIQETVKELTKEKEPIDLKIKELEDTLKQLNEKLSSLGFFKGAEKKETKLQIELKNKELDEQKKSQKYYIDKIKESEDIASSLPKEKEIELTKLKKDFLSQKNDEVENPYIHYKYVEVIRDLNNKIAAFNEYLDAKPPVKMLLAAYKRGEIDVEDEFGNYQLDWLHEEINLCGEKISLDEASTLENQKKVLVMLKVCNGKVNSGEFLRILEHCGMSSSERSSAYGNLYNKDLVVRTRGGISINF